FLVLSLAGLAGVAFAPWIGAAVAVVVVVVIACYRQNVRAYPSGGGDYEVATVNLRRDAGVTVGSALLIDFVLTLAVSLSSAAAVGSMVPSLRSHQVLIAVVGVIVVAAVNLRGLRRTGASFAIPVYAFIACMTLLIVWGLAREWFLGGELRAESAGFEVVSPD